MTEVRLTPSCLAMARLLNPSLRSCFISGTDATHVLDGLLYHETDLRIEEHYTDTGGFTDHVFALCHLLGLRFAPRIRNLGDTRLYSMEKPSSYATLAPLIGGIVNKKQITGHWDEILRLVTSIKHGSVADAAQAWSIPTAERSGRGAEGTRQD